MNLETHVVFLDTIDRRSADRLSGSIFSSIEELKGELANDGIQVRTIQTLDDFQFEWNDKDNTDGLKSLMFFYLMTYVYIVS